MLTSTQHAVFFVSLLLFYFEVKQLIFFFFFLRLMIHSAEEISAILSHLTQQIHVNCFTCVSKPPAQGDRSWGRGGAVAVMYPETYRHISPLVRRVLPGTLSSLYPPWCSGIRAIRGVPVEREEIIGCSAIPGGGSATAPSLR